MGSSTAEFRLTSVRPRLRGLTRHRAVHVSERSEVEDQRCGRAVGRTISSHFLWRPQNGNIRIFSKKNSFFVFRFLQICEFPFLSQKKLDGMNK